MSRSDRSFMRAFSPKCSVEEREESPCNLPNFEHRDPHREAEIVEQEVEIATESKVGIPEIETPHFALDVGLEWERTISVPTTVTSESTRVITDHNLQERLAAKKKKPWEPKLEVDRFAFSRPCQLFAEQASQILSIMDGTDDDPKIINVRSWARGEGRATISIALAKNLAQQGYDVVLVDGDIDNPELAEELGISFQDGWETCLDNPKNLADVCIRSVEDEFCLLPRCASHLRRFEPDLTEKLSELLNQLSLNFDYVLMDAGPGSQIWDSLATDMGNLIVVDNRKVQPRNLPEFFENASDGMQTVVGTIHNFSKAA